MMLNSMTETAEPLVPNWGMMALPLIAGLALFAVALVSIARNSTYSSGGTFVWALLVLALPVLGPVLWFLIGRRGPSPVGGTASVPKDHAEQRGVTYGRPIRRGIMGGK
jgi:hypothetical protein